jgi:hypothetical protein
MPEPEESKTTTDETTLREAGHRDASVLRTAGQRRINLLWEGTQALIAISVNFTILYVAAVLILKSAQPDAGEAVKSLAATALVLLGNIVSLVVATYFMRTNHVNKGGVQIDDQGR